MMQQTINQEQVIINLDISFSSENLKTTFVKQTQLHMEWEREALLFMNAIVTPLEYCIYQCIHRSSEAIKIETNVFIYEKTKTLSRSLNAYYFPQSTVRIPFREPHLAIQDRTQETNEIPQKKRKIKDEIDTMDEIPIHFRNDRDFMIAKVKENGLFLHYAHPDLLFDTELLLEAIKNNSDAFKYVPFSLKRNERFVKKAIEISGQVFMYLSEEFRGRADLFEIAFLTYSKAFDRAGKSIRNTQYFASQAIAKYWKAIFQINSLSPIYPILINKILSSDIDVKELINSNLITYKKDLMELIDISHKAYFMASANLQNDEQVLEKALRKDLMIANYLSIDQLRIIINNHSLINQIVQYPKLALKQELVLLIIETPNNEIVRHIIKKYPHLAEKVTIREIMLDPFIMRYLPTEQQLNKLNENEKHLCKQENRDHYVKLGYFYRKENQSGLKILKERFSQSHPGLVIPFHRFGFQNVINK